MQQLKNNLGIFLRVITYIAVLLFCIVIIMHLMQFIYIILIASNGDNLKAFAGIFFFIVVLTLFFALIFFLIYKGCKRNKNIYFLTALFLMLSAYILFFL